MNNCESAHKSRTHPFPPADEVNPEEKNMAQNSEYSLNQNKNFIHEPFPGLFLLDLPQDKAGFRMFISAWFFKDRAGRNVLVDPGPASTIPLLKSLLDEMGETLDLILITHIHLDHSGGLGHLLQHYPQAKIIAHAKGHRHLSQPERLWEASVATLGDVAVMYRQPIPVPSSSIMETDDKNVIEIFLTPGHASHHLSFRTEFGERKFLFAGEAAGSYIPLGKGKFWCRPATPPVCNPRIFLDSIASLKSQLTGDEILCYAHWGAVENAKSRLDWSEEQLSFWVETISRHRDKAPETIVEKLLQSDERLQGIALPRDLMEKELSSMKNSVKGILKGLSA